MRDKSTGLFTSTIRDKAVDRHSIVVKQVDELLRNRTTEENNPVERSLKGF